MSRRLTVVLALALAGNEALAQARAARPPMLARVDARQYDNLRFRLVGPTRGGRVTTVTGVPSEPRTFYMGVASGGVFKTTDGGQSWLPITDGQVPVGSTGSIAVADSDPNVVYLGTGSDGLRSNVSTGRGVYRSGDAGKTWSFAGLYDAGQIGAVRVHPTNPNVVVVAAVGNLFKPNAERGVFKTTDGGRSWRKVLFVSDSTGAADVEFHASNPDILYAVMSRAERKPWTIISGAREGGIYKSTDGGESWRKITTGLPNQLFGKANVGVTRANPNRLYALIEAKPGGGLYRSDDAGESWSLAIAHAGMLQRPFYYTTLGVDPRNADVVYAGAEGFYKSTDGGKTFASMQGIPHGDHHDIWVNPNDSNIMIQANDGGANVSTDGGRTWSSQLNQPTSEIYGVWMDNQTPYRIYGAQQDGSTWIISSNALGGGQEFRNGPGCETGPILPHPKDPQIVYGSCKGQYEYTNYRTGQTYRYWVGGQSLYGNPGRDLILRFQRVSPMETSPHDPEVLYYGSQHVHRTRDKGATWERISPDLTWNPPHGQGASGEPITRDVTGEEFYSTLYAIRESPVTPGVIWTGANDGPFYVTRDNGRTWKNVTPKDLPTGGRVAFIDPSPHRAGSAYYAVYRYLLGDFQPYIYRTDDYGATWTRLTDGKNGIAADNPTRVVREDPVRPGLLYAGTEFGMYASFDNGRNWQPFNLNLPVIPINDVKIYKNDLIVATQGRAIWILDNLSPLQQIAAQQASASPVLYRPRDAERVRFAAAGGRGGGGGGGGRGAGPADPAAGLVLYPAAGAQIDYYLPAPAAVTLEIADAAGNVVRTLSSETASAVASTAPAARDPDDPEEQMRPTGGRGGRGGGAAGTMLPKQAGLNRALWDFNHVNGMLVPPGTYRVKMTSGSYTATQPLVVKMDPRLAADGVTAADLREQFDHNVRVNTLIADANQVATRIRQARTRLRGASGAAADTAARVERLAVTMFGPDEGVRYGKPGLLAHITYIRGMSTGYEGKVGRDAIRRAAVLRRELDAVKADLARVAP